MEGGGLQDASIHLRLMIPISQQLNCSRAHSNKIKQHKYSLLNTLCKSHNKDLRTKLCLRTVTPDCTVGGLQRQEAQNT